MPDGLFTPGLLGDIAMANRIVMAPMTRNRAGGDGVPTPLMGDYYAQRASAGLIVTEAIQVSQQGQSYPATPGLHSPEQVAAWRAIVSQVHEAGGRIVAQLCHAGRISHSSLQPGGALPVGPSPVAAQGHCYDADWRKQPFETPHALDPSGLQATAQDFAAAARNALEAGFDGIEIHAGNGYLIDQFLRDGSNRRTDDYGGSPRNRGRLLCEVVEAVAGGVPHGRLGVRFSPWNDYNDMHDSAPRTLFPEVAAALAPFGLAYVHVVEPAGIPDPIAGEIARAAKASLIVNGGYLAENAERIVASGEAQAVSFAKPFIANPDLAARFRRGAPLAEADQGSIYGGGAKGYTDYQPLDRMASASDKA